MASPPPTGRSRGSSGGRPRERREHTHPPAKYVHEPDGGAVTAALATAVAARLDGDPLWTLIIAPPSTAKTEIVRLIEPVADEAVDELTGPAALLGWSKGRNPQPTGLLSRVPTPALVTVADLSTLLAGSDRGQRDSTYALLRRVYDGAATREVGQHTPLRWEGRIGLVAAATPEVDRYSSHADALGPRWLYVRLPPLTSGDRAAAGDLAMEVAAQKSDLRRAAREEATGTVRAAWAALPSVSPTPEARAILRQAATVATLGRSAVPRHGYGRREIDGDPVREEPARLAGQLAALYVGLLALDVEEHAARALALRMALDSMPLVRRKVLGALATGETLRVSEIARQVASDRKVVRFALEELELLGAVAWDADRAEDTDDHNEGDGDWRPRRRWRLAGEEGPLITATFAAALVARGEKWDEKWAYTPIPPGIGRGNPTVRPTSASPNGSNASEGWRSAHAPRR